MKLKKKGKKMKKFQDAIKLQQIAFNTIDSVRWRWSSDGRFTVKLLYLALSDEGIRVDPRASKI